MRLPAESLAAMGEAGRAHIAATFEIGAVADTWERLYRARGRGAAGLS